MSIAEVGRSPNKAFIGRKKLNNGGSSEVHAGESILDKAREVLQAPRVLELGNAALRHLGTDVFDPSYGFIIASVGGTFPRPFYRDALLSGHLIRKAIEDVSMTASSKQQGVWLDVSQKVKGSFSFLWKYQKPDGFLTHEMERYRDLEDENHPMLKSGFYTHELGAEFMVNGDSVDATPRGLMEAVRLLSADEAREFLPKALRGFDAMEENMDAHHGFLTFDGRNPGLMSQTWMDSHQGRPLDSKGRIIHGSVAAIEVQAYAWSAMKRWANLIEELYPENEVYLRKAKELRTRADTLKEQFNKEFRTHDGYFAHALVFRPGKKGVHKDNRISINAGLAIEADVRGETIFATDEDVKNVVTHLISPTMFHDQVGIYTFDAKSVDKRQRPDGYHYGKNVSWPFASVLATEGIVKVAKRMGWEEGVEMGNKMMLASLMPMINDASFLEQFTYDQTQENAYVRFTHPGTTIKSNSIQTWTIAAFIRGLAHFGMLDSLDYSQYTEAQEEANRIPLRREYRAAMIHVH